MFRPKSVNPVPLRVKVCGLPGASSIKLTCAVFVPAAIALKSNPTTGTVPLLGCTTIGNTFPDPSKSVVLRVMLVTVIGAGPVFTKQRKALPL
jgi:hypothetical protein